MTSTRRKEKIQVRKEPHKLRNDVVDLAVSVVVLDKTFEVWVTQNEGSGQSDRQTR
jgi:hypothetical protein